MAKAKPKTKPKTPEIVCFTDERTKRRVWKYGDTVLNADLFRSLGVEKVEAALMAIEDEMVRNAVAQTLKEEWSFWARPDQILPDGEWRVILALAGRGWGKSRFGAQGVIEWKRQGFQHVNIIGPTYDDAWGVMVEGQSGILANCPRDMRPTVNLKKGLIWPDGSITRVFTAQEPERLRGKQHQKVWADELCAWTYDQDAWDQMKFGNRTPAHRGAPVVCNQVLVTTTPKPTKLLRKLMEDPQTYIIRGSTVANVANLSPDFYNDMQAKYAGTRLGRQELHAEVLDDNQGALWNRTQIDALRRNPICPKTSQLILPAMRRIVVAIDPAVTSNADSDETGIIVAGLGEDGKGYVLEDGTSKERISPDKWAKRAVRRFAKWDADRIIAEVNNGGDLVEQVIRAQSPDIPYTAVRASRGKITRAEPIAALYEQGRVHHLGSFPELEDQMCEYNPSTDKKSPDRMDALVWALTELMLGDNNAGVLDWMEQEVQRLGGVIPEVSQLEELEKDRKQAKLAKALGVEVPPQDEPAQIEVEVVTIPVAPARKLTAKELMRQAAQSVAAPASGPNVYAQPLTPRGQTNGRGIQSTNASLAAELDLIDEMLGEDFGEHLTPEQEDD